MPAHGERRSISKKPALACNRKKMFLSPNQPRAWDRLGTEKTPCQRTPGTCQRLQRAGTHSGGQGRDYLIPRAAHLPGNCFKSNSGISSGRRCCVSPSTSPCSRDLPKWPGPAAAGPAPACPTAGDTPDQPPGMLRGSLVSEQPGQAAQAPVMLFITDKILS